VAAVTPGSRHRRDRDHREMTERRLIRDRLLQQELEGVGINAHVSSDCEFVTMTMDVWTLRRLTGRLREGPPSSAVMTQHTLSHEIDVTLTVD